MSRIKPQMRAKQSELRGLLNEWDPVGVNPDGPGPVDEYDCLFGLIGRLRAGSSALELGGYVTQQLDEHFGLEPDAAQSYGFAERLFDWYWRDPLPGSRPPTATDSQQGP